MCYFIRLKKKCFLTCIFTFPVTLHGQFARTLLVTPRTRCWQFNCDTSWTSGIVFTYLVPLTCNLLTWFIFARFVVAMLSRYGTFNHAELSIQQADRQTWQRSKDVVCGSSSLVTAGESSLAYWGHVRSGSRFTTLSHAVIVAQQHG